MLTLKVNGRERSMVEAVSEYISETKRRNREKLFYGTTCVVNSDPIYDAIDRNINKIYKEYNYDKIDNWYEDSLTNSIIRHNALKQKMTYEKVGYRDVLDYKVIKHYNSKTKKLQSFTIIFSSRKIIIPFTQLKEFIDFHKNIIMKEIDRFYKTNKNYLNEEAKKRKYNGYSTDVTINEINNYRKNKKETNEIIEKLVMNFVANSKF